MVKRNTETASGRGRGAGATVSRSRSQPRRGAAAAGSNGPEGVPATVIAPPTHEQIAKRAYEIWVAKGRPQGLDEQNWREAEAELLAAAQ